MRIFFRPFMALCGFAVVAACSVAPGGAEFHDPYEQTNRRIHAFNKSVDSAVSGSGGGQVSVPDDLALVVTNFADNTALPGMTLNKLLQGDLAGAMTNALRFGVNTIMGVVGIGDPATQLGLLAQETDFGETLAVWGFGEGAYLELPILGPSTERDLAGRIVDFVIDPLDHVGIPPMSSLSTPATLGTKVLKRQRFGDSVDDMLYGSADSYAQARLAYLQHRRFELGQQSATTEIDPYAIDPNFE